MPLYMYQAAYTAESLAAQMKDPQDRLAVVGKQMESTGVKIITGGYCFGEYDVVAIMEAPNDTAAAGVAVAVAAGGAVRNGQTTRLLDGNEWIAALKNAATVGYQPKRWPGGSGHCCPDNHSRGRASEVAERPASEHSVARRRVRRSTT